MGGTAYSVLEANLRGVRGVAVPPPPPLRDDFLLRNSG
jgi:hypothetical protein